MAHRPVWWGAQQAHGQRAFIVRRGIIIGTLLTILWIAPLIIVRPALLNLLILAGMCGFAAYGIGFLVARRQWIRWEAVDHTDRHPHNQEYRGEIKR